MIKKIILSILALLILSAPFAPLGKVYAIDAIPNCGSGSVGGTPQVCSEVTNQTGQTNPVLRILKDAIDVISFLAGALAVVFIVAAALRFVLSGGDSSRMSEARANLINALAGIIVVGLAQTIVIFVLDKVK